MAIFPYEERWQVNPAIGSGGGEFSREDIEENNELFLYHAVHIDSRGRGRLCRANERVDGSFVSFDGSGDNVMLVYSFRQKGMRFRNGGTNVIPLGNKIIGAERVGLVHFEDEPRPRVVPAIPRYGYVQRYIPRHRHDAVLAGLPTISNIQGYVEDAIDEAIESIYEEILEVRGFVRPPTGARHSNGTKQSPADVIVEFGFG